MNLPGKSSINRRQFLKKSGVGAAGVLTAGTVLSLNLPEARAAGEISSEFIPDVDIDLTAAPKKVQLLPGDPTGVWSYSGKVLKGDSRHLTIIEKSYLGPIIRVSRGQKVRIRFTNQIRYDSIIHWHGLHIPAEMDGHPRFVIPQGKTFVYEFEVQNRAGTYWYHPHPHGSTGPQVYGGMAGLFIVTDEEEQAAGLPEGEFDLPLVIQDRSFDRENQLVYLSNNMERMTGFLGDHILVNGRPKMNLQLATSTYRFRILNGSNSRIYRLAWSDQSPLIAIGNDGGLLEKPVKKRQLLLGPGERIELWADFSKYKLGTEVSLVSLPLDDRMTSGGMMGRRMGSNGSGFNILKVSISKDKKIILALPDQLSEIKRYQPADAVNYQNPKRFSLQMRHMTGTINGRTFEMEAVADEERVKLNTMEIWEFRNGNGGRGMMGMGDMPHPIHLHGKQFQILERSGVNHDGYIDQGWKDTVLVLPGERIKILVRFEDHPGLFLYHCHNLEHEDMGMMRNYSVESNIRA